RRVFVLGGSVLRENNTPFVPSFFVRVIAQPGHGSASRFIFRRIGMTIPLGLGRDISHLVIEPLVVKPDIGLAITEMVSVVQVKTSRGQGVYEFPKPAPKLEVVDGTRRQRLKPQALE